MVWWSPLDKKRWLESTYSGQYDIIIIPTYLSMIPNKRWSALVNEETAYHFHHQIQNNTRVSQTAYILWATTVKKYQKKTKQKNLNFLRFTWCASDLNEHPRLAFLNICHIAPDIKILARIHQPSHVHIPMPMPERAFPISNCPSQHVIQ